MTVGATPSRLASLCPCIRCFVFLGTSFVVIFLETSTCVVTIVAHQSLLDACGQSIGKKRLHMAGLWTSGLPPPSKRPVPDDSSPPSTAPGLSVAAFFFYCKTSAPTHVAELMGYEFAVA